MRDPSLLGSTLLIRHRCANSGKKSTAIFYDANARNATVHCSSFCAKWSVQRSAIGSARGWRELSGDTLALIVLGCDPQAKVLKQVSRVASEIDTEAKSFWIR